MSLLQKLYGRARREERGASANFCDCGVAGGDWTFTACVDRTYQLAETTAVALITYKNIETNKRRFLMNDFCNRCLRTYKKSIDVSPENSSEVSKK